MTTNSSDPNIYMLNPGIVNTQLVSDLGNSHPIDAGHYHILAFRLCSSRTDNLDVYWYLDSFGAIPLRIGDLQNTSWIPLAAECRLYAIDLATAQAATYAWSGVIKGLRIDPGFLSGTNLQLDWIRLTSFDPAQAITLSWSGVDTGTTLNFYLNSSCSLTGAMPVGSAPRSGQSAGDFQWGASLQALPGGGAGRIYPLPASFQPGPYTVLMQVDNAASPDCSPSPLEIRAAPILSFNRPSMLSGPDYATIKVGDPWGMDNAADITLMNDITNSSFSAGIWNFTAGTTDPYAVLHLGPTIDTTKYKYASIRMKLDASPPGIQQFLTVERWIWGYLNPAVDAVTTRDLLVYEGWHTYSLDLSHALIEPASGSGSWTGTPRYFRFDPDEETYQINTHVDFVLLTGEESVNSGQPFTLLYDVTPTSGVSVSFYYDVDTNPANGRTPMVPFVTTPYLTYLPLILNGFGPTGTPEIAPPTGQSWIWDTRGVAPGTYYVCADVSDGFNTTTWYSHTPVIVQ